MRNATRLVIACCTLLLTWTAHPLAQPVHEEPGVENATPPVLQDQPQGEAETNVQHQPELIGTEAPTAPEPEPGGIAVSLRLEVDHYCPTTPTESHLQLVIANHTDQPCKIPARYDSEYLTLYGQGSEHRHTSFLAVVREPTPITCLTPGEERRLLDIPLAVLFAPLQGRPDWGQMFWTWMAHPMPPPTPIYRDHDLEYVDSVSLWAELRLGSEVVSSSRVTLPVRCEQ
ncbi:MAG: hypothetical protein JW797_19895 [Bradymonadales bacterium]|nr:hypothetical protein [Bradymonadales bacterium]